MLYSHSKTLLRDSLLNDSDFLSSSGNIDYSLLVGVDDERCVPISHASSHYRRKLIVLISISRKELVVGLIDVLGVFDIRKRLEHQIKTGAKLATGADAATVTVLPPENYAARFRQGESLNLLRLLLGFGADLFSFASTHSHGEGFRRHSREVLQAQRHPDGPRPSSSQCALILSLSLASLPPLACNPVVQFCYTRNLSLVRNRTIFSHVLSMPALSRARGPERARAEQRTSFFHS
jgi:hypothetical protein